MSSTLWTYNQIIQRLEVFAEGHYFLASFTHGQIDVKNLEKFPTYPHMHVIPEGFDYGPQEKTFNFRVLVFDKPRQVEEKPDYQKEVISDTQQVIEDLVYELKNGRTLFGKEVDTPESFSITAFMESFENVVTGCEAVISITVPNQWSACNIPANWALSGSGSTTSPAYGGLVLRTDGVNNAVQNILDLVQGSNITITDLGDGRVRIAATGGGGGGLTCGDLATCQTILDILQSITDVDRDLTTLSNAFTAHASNTSNPHSVTKSQVGLGNVDNTSDADKPVSTAQAAADAAVQAFSIQRANHTGTQPINTISDATTVGQNIVKLTNPSAVRYLQVNADNTVTALSALQLREAIGIRWAQVTGSDYTTTSATESVVTGLSLPVVANAKYRGTAVLRCGCSGTGGLRVGFNFPTGATCFAGITANTLGSTTQQHQTTGFASGTAFGANFNTQASANGYISVDFYVGTGANAGNVEIIARSGTSPQTSTVYAGLSTMRLERIDA